MFIKNNIAILEDITINKPRTGVDIYVEFSEDVYAFTHGSIANL